MGYYPNQYGGPMNGMGGNMRPAYGAPNGMPGGMMPGMGRPPMMHNNYNYGNYGNNNYGNYGMPPMMQQPQPPMYGGPARGGMGPRGRGQQSGRMVCVPLVTAKLPPPLLLAAYYSIVTVQTFWSVSFGFCYRFAVHVTLTY